MSASQVPPGDSPDGLFARAKGGDQAAWEELFHTCYPKIIEAVRRRLNQPLRSLYDSTDFASHAINTLAANVNRLDFPTIDSLLAFLTRVAEQKVLDEYRRMNSKKRDMKRVRTIVSERHTGESEIPIASDDPTPSQMAQARETHERLLAQQDAEKQTIINLRSEGFTNEEVADQMGWHVRKVQRFLKYLQNRYFNPPES